VLEKLFESSVRKMTDENCAIRGGNQKFPELLKKLFKVFVQVLNFSPHSKYSPRDWMQQSQHRSQCWKHCLKSSTEMLPRAASESLGLLHPVAE
jgi:hypothetical protein